MRSLARADGRRLTTSVWFLIGVAMALLGSGVFVMEASADGRSSWSEDAWTIHAGFLLLAMFAMVAVNAASLRDHRAHTEDQHRALPTSGQVRVTALTTASLWPSAIAIVLLGAVVAAASRMVTVPAGTAMVVVHQGALVMMMGSLGVALGVWLRSSFVGPVVAIAFFVVHPGETPAAWHALWPFASLTSARLEGVHLVYLLGLSLVLLAIAQVRWGMRREQLTILLSGCALTVGSGVMLVAHVCPGAISCSL